MKTSNTLFVENKITIKIELSETHKSSIHRHNKNESIYSKFNKKRILLSGTAKKNELHNF